MTARVVQARGGDDEHRIRLVLSEHGRPALRTEPPLHAVPAVRGGRVVLRGALHEPERRLGNEEPGCVRRPSRSLTVPAVAVDRHERLGAALVPDATTGTAAGDWLVHQRLPTSASIAAAKRARASAT